MVGSELEIDHFQPKSAGGGDELENLIYCCTPCNRHKAMFWPIVDAAQLHAACFTRGAMI
jgi:HNH endonuclease